MKTVLLYAGLALSVFASPIEAKASRVYTVIFEVTLGPDNRVADLKVAKVIDPASGSTAAVDIPVPEAYVQAAREHLLTKTYSGDQRKFFTYLYFDPKHPTR